MVSNQITRMEAFDDSDRAGYEIVLKHAATTAFIGETSFTEAAVVKSYWVYVSGSAETVCSTYSTSSRSLIEDLVVSSNHDIYSRNGQESSHMEACAGRNRCCRWVGKTSRV